MKNTLAVVSLSTIEKNARLLQDAARVPLIAVVKDDAYGHGAERVAGALLGVASAFAVANSFEGAALRIAGIGTEILVLSPAVTEEEGRRIARYGLTAALSSLPALRLAASCGVRRGQIAVNTGMNRYGFPPCLVERACRAAKRRGIEITGVFSHLYAPDNLAAAERQRDLFLPAADAVKQAFPQACAHLSATGGSLLGAPFRFDAVRCGIGLYGYLPDGFVGRLPVRPAMKLYARVSQSGDFLGGGAGYAPADREYAALHTLRFGYGDGFFRNGGLGVGTLCMDACLREGKLPFGTEVRLLPDLAAYAKAHGTIPYEILTSVGERAVKVYV